MSNKTPVLAPDVPELATSLDLADLRAFCRVVDLGSVTAAARDLGTAKSNVSRRLARLEGVVGAVLLRRERRRLEPTDEGRAFREKAGRALELLDDATRDLSGAAEEPAGLVRLTVPQGLAATVLPAVLAEFLELHPRVSLEVLATDAVLSFRDHRIDAALRASRGLPDSSLVAWRLLTFQPELVAAPTYLSRRGVPEHPLDLLHHDLLLIPIDHDGVRLVFEPLAGGRPVEVRLVGRVRSHEAALLQSLAAAGGGIAYRLPAGDEARSLVPVLPGWRVVADASLYLLTAPGLLPPKVRALRDHLRGRLTRQG